MTVTLYRNTAPKNQLDKSNNLTLVDTLTGTEEPPLDIEKPVILIESDTTPTCNYVYITEYSRYYFVLSIEEADSGHVWRLTLLEDYLYTFKNIILNNSGFVTRCDGEYNENLIDTSVPQVDYQTHARQLLSPMGSHATNHWKSSSEIYSNYSRYSVVVVVDAHYFTNASDQVIWPQGENTYLFMSINGYLTLMRKVKTVLNSIVNDLSAMKYLAESIKDAYVVPWDAGMLSSGEKTSIKKLWWYGKFFSDSTVVSPTDVQVELDETAYLVTPGLFKEFVWQISMPLDTPFYKNVPPFKHHYIEFLPLGFMEINSMIANNTEITPQIFVTVRADVVKGTGVVYYGYDVTTPLYLGITDFRYQFSYVGNEPGFSFLNAVADTASSMLSTANAKDPKAIAGSILSGVAKSWDTVNQKIGTSICPPGTGIIAKQPALVTLTQQQVTVPATTSGRMLYETKQLLSLVGKGLTVVSEINLTGINTGTKNEIDNIINLLGQGVIL